MKEIELRFNTKREKVTRSCRLTGWFAVLLALGLGGVGARASIHTNVYQQVDGGAAVVYDTFIYSDGNYNFGQAPVLTVLRDGDANALLKFVLTNIPPNAAVLSATLSLHNNTESSWTGVGAYGRRINLYRVSRDWDEGNQVGGPLAAPGDHGATPTNAFEYFDHPDRNVAWGAPGMLAGTDYSNEVVSYADVADEGDYTWDMTTVVRDWVRLDQPNFGLTLRDGTGYDDRQRDWRDFDSSQGSDQSRRPKLTVLFDPDTPHAEAGPDQVNFTWNGGPITLDGSGSYDRPGGSTATLSYLWRVISPAYGSALTNAVLGTNVVVQFTPDACGEYELELEVTNDQQELATDRVHLSLYRIPTTHPRIYVTPEILATLRARAVDSNPRWTQVRDDADQPDGDMHAQALAALITGQQSYATQAIAQAYSIITNGYDWVTTAGDIALVYDWCFPWFTTTQRDAFISYFNTWGDDVPKSEDVPGWGNYYPRYAYSYALIGLASFGENPRAQEWLEEFRYHRYRDHALDELARLGPGGGWPEGICYDGTCNMPRIKSLEAWRTATGEDLFQSASWYRERLGYVLLHRYPGLADNYGYEFHPYLVNGDSDRNRGSMVNYERIMALVLIGRFPADPVAQQLQAYLATAPADHSMGFECFDEFLWFNPDVPTSPPTALTHYLPGLGQVLMRSGWPDGPADTNPCLTYVAFNCGDHFAYHQHLDQNSFTIYKGGDLAIDSGIYDAEGLGYHDINYYIRTIAHNTLVVYNPNEDFSTVRDGATSNDGGQRSFSPASRSPQTVQEWDQHAVNYHTGEILRFADGPLFTYALGDATMAYNNPQYNQAMDGMTGNVAKVTGFQREFLYLRSDARGSQDCVVLCDRVGVTDANFSGANTKLLFHMLNEPRVSGAGTEVSPGETLYTSPDQVVMAADAGQLFLKVLWPQNHHVRKVGGRGVKAFWVFGAQWDYNWDPQEPQPRPINDFEDEPYGEWRVELEPADTALEHTFLSVLYPTTTNTSVMPPVSRVAADGMLGACVANPDNPWVILFSESNSAPAGPFTFSYQPAWVIRYLVFDLAPGCRYSCTATQASGAVTVTLTPDSSGFWQADAQGVLLVNPLRLFLSGASGPVPTFHWYGFAGATYSVERSTTLLPGSWQTIASHVPATSPYNTYSDFAATGLGPFFYRVRLE